MDVSISVPDNISTNQLADNAVTGPKINPTVAGSAIDHDGTSLNVVVDDETIQVNAGALRVMGQGITRDKLGGGYLLCGPITTSVTAGTTNTALGSFTVYGRPLMIIATGGSWATSGGGISDLKVQMNGADVYIFNASLADSATYTVRSPGIGYIGVVSAGTYTMNLQLNNTSTGASVTSLSFLIYEL
jgi:hypothetical protein